MNLKLQERVPLSKLQIIEELSTPLQRKAKIYSRRLPGDFFAQRSIPMNQNRNQAQTPQMVPRRLSNIQRPSETQDLKVRTGHLSSRMTDEDQTLDLLRGVISTSREMRKMIRRHSLQMKKQNNNLREYDNYRVELPPLMLKKGVTCAI